jgi:hypothetical protein
MNVLVRAMTALFVIALPVAGTALPAGASLDGPCTALGTVDGVHL